MTVPRFIMLWVFCCMTEMVNAQTDTSFWFAAPVITYNRDGIHSDRPISLHFTTLSKAATITISQPANSSFIPIQVTLPANSSSLKDLTPHIASIETQPADISLNYGLLIRSTAFISAYYEESSPNNPEIFVLKGRNALGKNFFIPAQNIMRNGLTTGKLNATSSFDIVATEDNTVVTIKPSNDIIGHSATSGWFNITLQKGQTYSATASGILGIQHLMGSTVTSNYPIAITIKDDSIGDTEFYSECEDLAGDQIVPLELVGTKYISIPGYLNKGPSTPPTDHLFILATQDLTTVTINGILEKTLAKGETYWKKSFNDVFYIETNWPVYVLQLSGFSCEVGHVLLPQLECTGSKTVGFMRSNKSKFFLHLLVPAGGENQFKLNGNSTFIRVDSFHSVPNTQWKYARIPLTTYQLPLDSPAIVTNPVDFHLAIIDGDENGVRYGYFSSFNAFTAVPKSIPGTDKPFCEGDYIQLFCDVGSSEDIGFVWKGPNGFGSTEQNPMLKILKFADAGTYTCTATKPNCYPVTISINVKVMPPITRSLSVNNLLCEKDTLVLAVSSATVGASFLWSGPNNFVSSVVNDSIPGVSAARAGSYILKITDTNGCFVKDTVIVTVNPLPSTTISGGKTLCEKDSLSINGTSPLADAVFQWKGPSGYTGSLSKLYITKVSTVNAGAYILTTTLATGCFVKDTVNVFVNPLPTVLISGNDIICENDSLSLNAYSSSAGIVYKWNGSANYTSNVSNAYIAKMLFVNSGIYVLTTTGLTGCLVKDTVNVTVSPLPSIQITGSGIICEQDSLSLNGTSSTSDVGFGWNGPASYTSTIPNIYIKNSSLANGGKYVLTTTSAAGCAAKDSVEVTVKPLPSASITSNDPPCRLSTLQLNNNNTLSGSAYSWTHNYNLISNQQNVSIIPFIYSDTGKYYLIISSNSCIAEDSITVGMREIPALKFDNINGICLNGLPFQIMASDTSGITGSGVFSGNGISEPGIFDPFISGTGSSTIRYTYTANNGCSDFKDQSITVYQLPVVNTISPVTIFAGGTAWLNTTVVGDIKSFNWTPATGLNDPVLESPTATPLSNTNYIVTVINDQGCTASDTAVIKVLNGIKIPNAFSPNGDAINDKWMIDNLAGFKESTVNVFDRYGKKVFNSKGYNTPWDGNYNGNPLPVATYYYVITVSDGYLSQTYNGWVVLLR